MIGLLSTQLAGGQCVAIDFTLPSNGCIGQDINVAPASTYLDYEWDFCAGDLDQSPSASIFYGAAGSAYKIELVEQSGQYFGFYTSRNNGKLYRLDFGTDITSTPVPIDLGGLGISSSTWLTIEVVKEGAEYYGFIIDITNKVYRFGFGTSVTNAPMNGEELYSNALLANPIDLVVQEDESGKYLFIANIGSNKITRFAFASSFGEAIGSTSIDEIVVSGSGNLSGISFIRECELWYAVTTSLSGGNISKIVFDGGLADDTPVISQVTGLPFTPNAPGGIALAFEDNKYYAFIQAQQTQSNLYKIDFGSSMANSPLPSSADLGDFGLLTNILGFSMHKVKSDWLVLGSENTGQNIYRISFPNRCFSNLKFSTTNENTITATAGSGTYQVSLTSHNAMGYVLSTSKSITFSSNTPPDISISSQNVCVGNDVFFTSSNTSGNITNYNWDFGDLQSSTNQNPVKTYSTSGEYTVKLVVTASNACTNFTQQHIKIYNSPVASFTLPSITPVCTNNELIFENTTPDNFDGNLTYQWLIDNQPYSTTRDLLGIFVTPGAHDVALQTLIPGCSNTVLQNVGGILEGPVTNFSFSGQCEDEIVAFTNNSSGAITGFTWNFDDGTNSTDTNPTHTFSNIGVYDVELTTSNAAGCNNSKIKSISIYSKPQVNFQLSPPPFSCNGTPSQFNDLTPTPPDSNIASWAWNFGDAGSSENTSIIKDPQHTYVNSGNYDVSLVVTTNFFCSATLQLPVVISPSPVANFTHGATCEDVPSNFTDASTGTISTRSWTIGSTTYTSQNPSHTFNNAGNTSASLIVTASNGCIGTVTEPIVVPVKLTPDFSVLRNCVNQQTVFTDLTNATADPLSLQSWNFGAAGTATGSPVNVTFSNTGNVSVTLSVTTQSGCVYPVSKPVNIISSPQASFTPSPLVGAPPLSIVFTNTSVNATSYQWAFNDPNNSTSTVVSPTFVYQALGEYPAELTAFNTQNCFHKTTRIIRVVVPVVDVALGGLELMEFQNGFKPAVTIFNNGNVPLVNLALLLNMSGPVIREHVNAIITPNTSYRHVLSLEFPASSNVDYFCIEAEVTDITPTDNEVCLSLEESFTTFPPYPNPSKGSFQLDWIMKEAGTVNLTVSNSMGQEMQNLKIESVEGLNPITLETYGLSSGVYFVKIKYQQFAKVYRVFVSE